MGGMNNKTSKELSAAKIASREFHANQNEKLYKEYLNSEQQHIQTFLEWKNSGKDNPIKKEKMQKPLSAREKRQVTLRERTLNQRVRWK